MHKVTCYLIEATIKVTLDVPDSLFDPEAVALVVEPSTGGPRGRSGGRSVTAAIEPMTLGALIDALEAMPPEEGIEFDFGYMRPTTLDSWRGVYAYLALGYEGAGAITVADLLTNCCEAVGAYFDGWKGGSFLMSRETPIYVDNPGEYSGTMVVGVGRRYGSVVLLTSKAEVEA